MSQIAFLIAENDVLEDGNYLRLANECRRRGHQAWLCTMESIAMERSTVVARGSDVTAELAPGATFPRMTPLALEDLDIIWVLSLGMRHSFLDKMQLLFTLQDRCRIINSLDAIMHLKSKYFISGHPDVFRHPATWASNDPDSLFDVMQREGGQWIVKPPASSFGRDVYLLTAADPNARVILESMCGPEQDNYCLLQRYVPEIAGGEKRVLIAGGRPVGQYLRTASRDHRTNIQQGALAQPCDLTAEERAGCERIGQFLLAHGAQFAGIDLAWPWLIEFNVINPGGVLTIDEVSGKDITPAIVDNILGPRSGNRTSPGNS